MHVPHYLILVIALVFPSGQLDTELPKITSLQTQNLATYYSKSLAENIKANIPDVAWIKEVQLRDSFDANVSSDKLLLLDPDPNDTDGELSKTRKVKYKGKTFWAKIPHSLHLADKALYPQAKIYDHLYKNLSTEELKGINIARHFMQLDNNEKTPVILYDALEGEPLEKMFNRYPQGLPEEMAIAIVLQLSKIIASLHRVGVMHWDIKPSNVWITRENKVILMDFEIAFFAADQEDFQERKLYESIGSKHQASLKRLLQKVGASYALLKHFERVPQPILLDAYNGDVPFSFKDETFSIGMVLLKSLMGTRFNSFTRLISFRDQVSREVFGMEIFDYEKFFMEAEAGKVTEVSPQLLPILKKALYHLTSQYETVEHLIHDIENRNAPIPYQVTKPLSPLHEKSLVKLNWRQKIKAAWARPWLKRVQLSAPQADTSFYLAA